MLLLENVVLPDEFESIFGLLLPITKLMLLGLIGTGELCDINNNIVAALLAGLAWCKFSHNIDLLLLGCLMIG